MNYTELNAQDKAQGTQQATLQSLEAKIDKILAYQKSTYHLAVFRGVFDFIVFMLIVVLPIVGGYYLFRSIATQVDFGKLSDQYGQITEGLDTLKAAQSDAVNQIDLKAILNNVKPK